MYRFAFIEGTSFWGTFFVMVFIGMVSASISIGTEVQNVEEDSKEG
jgi:hypothetical protein